MLLIHLSDIHFRKGESGTPYDPNALVRAKLIEDAVAQCQLLGEVPAAILVSGDIAFAGRAEEYDFAARWLEELATRCGVTLALIFPCPGNHDVDREVTRKPAIRGLHIAIRAQGNETRDSTIAGLLQDEESNGLLFKSIRNYNTFAARFFCALTPPGQTIARRTLQFNDGSLLELWGLNSTLASNESDEKGRLVIDPAYNQIVRKPGVENLVMSHHPPIWLNGGDAYQSHLDSVAVLHLFGHQHDHQVKMERKVVRLAAGALQPDRSESLWEPCYNIIQLRVDGGGSDRQLKVGVHARIWQRNPDQFRAKMDEESTVFSHTIPLTPWVAPPPAAAPITSAAAASESTQAVQQVDPMDSLREIGIRFFKLTLSQRALVAGQLNLLEQEDEYKPDFERYQQAFRRARERNLISQLDAAVSAQEKNNN